MWTLLRELKILSFLKLRTIEWRSRGAMLITFQSIHHSFPRRATIHSISCMSCQVPRTERVSCFYRTTEMYALALIRSGHVVQGLRESEFMFRRIKESPRRSAQLIDEVDEFPLSKSVWPRITSSTDAPSNLKHLFSTTSYKHQFPSLFHHVQHSRTLSIHTLPLPTSRAQHSSPMSLSVV